MIIKGIFELSLGLIFFVLTMLFATNPLAPILLGVSTVMFAVGTVRASSSKSEKPTRNEPVVDCRYFSSGKCTGVPNVVELQRTECTNSAQDACCQICPQTNCAVSCEDPIAVSDKDSPQDPEELRQQLDENKKELDTVYGECEKLQKIVRDLQKATDDKDKTILKLKRQLKTERTERTESTEIRKTVETKEARQSKPIPADQSLSYAIDLAVYNHIVDHGGTISITGAAQQLNITPDELKNAIERLKKDGRLAQG